MAANPQVSRVHQNEGELYLRTRLVNTNHAARQRVNDTVLGLLLALDDSGDPLTVCAGNAFLVEATTNLVVKVNAGWALQYTNEDQGADPYAALWRRARLAADANLSVDAGGADDRIDIVQVRAVETQQDQESCEYMDEDGNKSDVPLYTRYLEACEVQVKKGVEDPAPVAPDPDAGWFKVAEIAVGAGVSAILGGDINDSRTAPQTSFAASLYDLLVRNDLTVWDDLILGGDGSPVEPRVLLRRAGSSDWVLSIYGAKQGETAGLAAQLFLRATRYTSGGVDRVEWNITGPKGYGVAIADDGEAADCVLGGAAADWRIRATKTAAGKRLLRFMLDGLPPTSFLDIDEDGKIINPTAGVNLVGSFKMSVPIACAIADDAGWSWNQTARRWECAGLTPDDKFLRVDLPAFLFSGGTTRFKSITAFGALTKVTGTASMAMTVYAEQRSSHGAVGGGASWTVGGGAEQSSSGLPVNVDATSHYFITFSSTDFDAAGDGFTLYDIIVEFETV
jgi:hypothetical protein